MLSRAVGEGRSLVRLTLVPWSSLGLHILPGRAQASIIACLESLLPQTLL